MKMIQNTLQLRNFTNIT